MRPLFTLGLILSGLVVALLALFVVLALIGRAKERKELPERLLSAKGGRHRRIGIQKPTKSTPKVTKRERILRERQGRRDGYITGQAAEGLSSTDTTASGVDHG